MITKTLPIPVVASFYFFWGTRPYLSLLFFILEGNKPNGHGPGRFLAPVLASPFGDCREGNRSAVYCGFFVILVILVFPF